jgi:hypothetical protein
MLHYRGIMYQVLGVRYQVSPYNVSCASVASCNQVLHHVACIMRLTVIHQPSGISIRYHISYAFMYLHHVSCIVSCIM